MRGKWVWLLAVWVLVSLCGVGWLFLTNSTIDKPKPAPRTYVRATRFLLQRGEYIFHVLGACVSCHSQRDETIFAMPLANKSAGSGGKAYGIPDMYGSPASAPSLTPATLGSWTDGEIIWAFTQGWKPGQKQLSVACPWPAYQVMDALDAQAVVAYLRQLPDTGMPLKGRVSLKSFRFTPATPTRRYHLRNKPLVTDTLATGAYLTAIAGCARCHAGAEERVPTHQSLLVGGRKFQLPGGGVIYASNLTPDSSTGIGRWSRTRFVQRFKHFVAPWFKPSPVHENGYNTPMPWYQYARLTEADLTAMYRYLMRQPAVENPVPGFEPKR